MIASLARATSLLSGNEKNRLAELETQIKDAFYRAGQALKEIRDWRLYRNQYPTFEDYCLDRWGIARNYANKLIAASDVVQNLSTIGTHIPASERQARPFSSLPPKQQIDAWQEVVATAQKGRITTALCEKVAEKYKKMSTTGTQPEPISQPNKTQENLAWFQEQSMKLTDLRRAEAYIRDSVEGLWIKVNNMPDSLESALIKFQLRMMFYEAEIYRNQIVVAEIRLANNPWGFAVD
jgi:hypothetical protein